jgi:hypothetical protein
MLRVVCYEASQTLPQEHDFSFHKVKHLTREYQGHEVKDKKKTSRLVGD